MGLASFTDAWDTNAVWVGDPDSESHECMEVKYEKVNFDGANTLHGNKDNLTGKSRLSIDFRIFPLKYYNEEEQADAKTITQKKRLIIGILDKTVVNFCSFKNFEIDNYSSPSEL